MYWVINCALSAVSTLSKKANNQTVCSTLKTFSNLKGANRSKAGKENKHPKDKAGQTKWMLAVCI